jgi:hypothetical protein
MSFLSRRSSRPDKHGGGVDAGRRADSEYDDYDYAPDDYQQDDDNWSPDEYFSPEGIKGRWAAGARPGERGGAGVGGGERGGGERGGGRGRHSGGRDSARDSRSPRDSREARDRDARDGRGGGRGYDGYDSLDSGPQRGRGPAGEYGRDDYQRDSYGPDRSHGAGDYGSRDYASGEYGSGEYATGAYDVTEDADGDRGGRSGGGGRRRRDRADKGDRNTGAWRQRLGLRDRDKDDDIWPDDGVSDEDYWASVAADRPLTSTGGPADAGPPQAADSRPVGRPAAAASGPGRLGPAPGLSAPSGAHSRPAAGASTGPGSGPMTRAASGPAPARSGTGPAPARPATGPGATRPGLPQPSFQPAVSRGAGEPAGSRGASRPPERPDWAERTERMDRVNASGYPDPRASGRVQMPAVSSPPAHAHTPPRGRGDSPDRRMPDPREPSRTSSVWDGGGADDDPLTSRAYSRSAVSDTDGRSYRAAHRSPVSPDRRDAALTEQTQTFSMPQYQSDPQAPTARYPAYGSQQTGPQPGQQPRQPAQPPRPQLPPSDGPGGGVSAMPGGGARSPYDRGTTASHPYSGQPYPASATDSDQYGRPQQPGGYGTGGYSTGGYDTGGYSSGGYDTGNYGAGANGNGDGYADNRRGGRDRDTGGHRYNGYGDGGKR